MYHSPSNQRQGNKHCWNDPEAIGTPRWQDTISMGKGPWKQWRQEVANQLCSSDHNLQLSLLPIIGCIMKGLLLAITKQTNIKSSRTSLNGILKVWDLGDVLVSDLWGRGRIGMTHKETWKLDGAAHWLQDSDINSVSKGYNLLLQKCGYCVCWHYCRPFGQCPLDIPRFIGCGQLDKYYFYGLFDGIFI